VPCQSPIYLVKCAVAAKALLVDHPVAINELHKVVRALSFVHDTKNDLFIRTLPLALIHKELSALQPLSPKHLDQDGCEGGGNDNARPTQRHTVRRKVSCVREPTVRRVDDKWARPLNAACKRHTPNKEQYSIACAATVCTNGWCSTPSGNNEQRATRCQTTAVRALAVEGHTCELPYVAHARASHSVFEHTNALCVVDRVSEFIQARETSHQLAVVAA